MNIFFFLLVIYKLLEDDLRVDLQVQIHLFTKLLFKKKKRSISCERSCILFMMRTFLGQVIHLTRRVR